MHKKTRAWLQGLAEECSGNFRPDVKEVANGAALVEAVYAVLDRMYPDGYNEEVMLSIKQLIDKHEEAVANDKSTCKDG